MNIELKNKKKFSDEEIMKLFGDMITGYKFFYDNKILHQNISPKSILKTSKGYKLGGF